MMLPRLLAATATANRMMASCLGNIPRVSDRPRVMPIGYSIFCEEQSYDSLLAFALSSGYWHDVMPSTATAAGYGLGVNTVA